jgi:hypothetical protein
MVEVFRGITGSAVLGSKRTTINSLARSATFAILRTNQPPWARRVMQWLELLFLSALPVSLWGLALHPPVLLARE